MPKSRTRSGSSKNVAASANTAPPPPLLDILLGSSIEKNSKSNSKIIDSKSLSGWQCNNDDWSDTTKDKTINVGELSSIVNDLITGKNDKAAYIAFLAILQHFSVHTLRDDHLEETVYHLIQAAVSFIRANEQRFDLDQLQECYRRRYIRKTNI